MDFLDPKKKRSHHRRLMIGYAMIAIALALGTLILVMVTNGFGFDTKNGEIIQYGLLQLDAHPQSAEILINGQKKDNTKARLNLPEGKYHIELSREGYRSWQHDVVVRGGQVEQLLYPFLFPTVMKPSTIRSYAEQPLLATESPDRHWLIVSVPGNIAKFEVADISKDKIAIQQLTLPSTIMKNVAGKHSLEAIEWSTDNRHVLLKHTFADGNEFIILDRATPANSFNINTKFAVSPLRVALRDKKINNLYLLDKTKHLSLADTKQLSVRPLLSNVLAFKAYTDKLVLFVTPKGATKGFVLLNVLLDGKVYTIRTLKAASRYLLDVAGYSNHMYAVVGSSAEKSAYIYKDPFNAVKDNPLKLPKAIRRLQAVGTPQYVSFSATAHYVILQSGKHFAVYNLDNERNNTFSISIPIAPEAKAQWMDGDRLTINSNDKAVVFDYDGANQQTLVASSAAFRPFWDRDYKNLFTLAPSSQKTIFNLYQTPLIVKN